MIQVSKEGDTFEVPTDIAKLSNLVVTTLGEEMEDDDDEDNVTEIPLPNVKATVLAKVIEYCTYYKNTEASKILNVMDVYIIVYCNVYISNLTTL